jgi:hypothetical protein
VFNELSHRPADILSILKAARSKYQARKDEIPSIRMNTRWKDANWLKSFHSDVLDEATLLLEHLRIHIRS